jgi:hypothetical protein
MTPTGRTLEHLRRDGWTAEVVERYLAQVERHRDYLGCVDIVAVKPGEPVLAVQATSLIHVAARVRKARAAPGLRAWLGTGHAAFQVWGWAKRGERWAVKVVELRPADLAPVVLQAPRRRRRAGKGQQQGLLFGDAGPAA